MKMRMLLLSIVLIVAIHSQNTNTAESGALLAIDEVYRIELQQGESQTYSLKIKGLNQGQSLFVEIESPYSDPYQEPSVSITSGDNYNQTCSEEVNEYAGICQVQNEDLKEGKQFEVQVTCFENCKLFLQAFLDSTLEIDFGHKLEIRSLQQMGTITTLKIQVPENLDFTDISIVATITDIATANEGVEMLVNVGDETVQNPTAETFDYRGHSAWGDGVGVFLSSDEVEAGNWIMVYMVLGQGVEVTLYTQASKGSEYQIALNSYYEDFTASFETKTYIVDLTQIATSDSSKANSTSDSEAVKNSSESSAEEKQDILSETIQIMFVIYSGFPSIEVSFDPEFETYLDNYDIEGTVSYLITPEIRALNGFSGKIYIRVQSYWASDYYLSTYAISDKYVELSDGVTQINVVEPGEVQNYIYAAISSFDKSEDGQADSEKVSTVKNYRVKVEVIEGNAEIGIRRCASLENNDTFDCLMYLSSEMDDPDVEATFDEIQVDVRADYNSYELYFQYDTALCPTYLNFQDFDLYACEFQIVMFPEDDNNLIYSITIYSEEELASLREGYIFRDFLYKDTSQYFTFQLPVLDNVEEVTFYMTIISGDALIMGTTNPEQKFMLVTDAATNDDIQISLFNTLTFTKEHLANTFYIGVYGFEAAEITLSVVVQRSESTTENGSTEPQNKTQLSSVALKEGLSQQYSLKAGYQQINFTFTAKGSRNVSVELIAIEGQVSFNIFKVGSEMEQVECNNQQQPGETKCTFESAEDESKFIVTVDGADQEDIQTFSVSYFYPNTCKKYPLNIPQFIFLAANEVQCSVFSITNLHSDLQIVTSFSTLDLLTTTVEFTITFNNDEHELSFDQRSKLIPADELKDFCKSDDQSNCDMKLTYSGDSSANLQFYFVVENVGREMALFDGIVRKVIDEEGNQITKSQAKHFYYEVSSDTQSIRIFATTNDNVGYYVVAKFVQSSEFMSSVSDDMYPQFREVGVNEIREDESIFETQISAVRGTSMIQIEPQDFSSYCTNCVMLISVYGTSDEQTETNSFEIEVTQEESFLYIGQQKVGFLSDSEVYVYEISANPQEESLLTLRDTTKQSSLQKDCFKAAIITDSDNSVQSISSYAIIPAGYETYRVIIEESATGNEEVCSYQVSYSALLYPVSVLTNFMPIQLNLTDSQVSYFLHFHKDSGSFDILNYVKSGDLKMGVNQIDDQNTVEDLVNKNIDLYAFRNKVGESYVHVSDQSDNFCKDCYYMIAVQGYPNILSEMAVSRTGDDIGLTTFGKLKQSLTEGDSLEYTYYSIFEFNITFSILYGKLNVSITDPEGNHILSSSLSLSREIRVPAPKSASGQYMNFYDERSKFTVKVEALQATSFYIGVNKKNVAMKLQEGVPISVNLRASEKTTVEFVNTNPNNSVSVLVEIKNPPSQFVVLSASAEVIDESQGSSQSKAIANPMVEHSESSYNFLFESVKGSYLVTFSSNTDIEVNVILAKKSLTHLMSTDLNLFTDEGIYEIYTPGHNLMIVIDSCESEVEVKASRSYQQILEMDQDQQKFGLNSNVLLEHANYGGHYVITAENVQGEYFVEVSAKKANESLLYLISYYYYDTNDIMPYKKVDISPEINYELTPDKIIFVLSPVRRLASKSQLNILPVYTLYISNSSEASDLDSKCGLNYGYSLKFAPSSAAQEPIKFPVDFSIIEKQIGPQTNIYFVSASVRVTFEDPNQNAAQLPYIDLAYTRTQITQTHHNVEFKSETSANLKFVILWIILPFLIAALLFVCAFKFCVKKYRQMYPDRLVEEDREFGESQDQIVNSSSNPSDSLKNT